jgi:hypothetical protein
MTQIVDICFNHEASCNYLPCFSPVSPFSGLCKLATIFGIVVHARVHRLPHVWHETNLNLNFLQQSPMCAHKLRRELTIRNWNQFLVPLPTKGRLIFLVHNKYEVNKKGNILKIRQFIFCPLKMKTILYDKTSAPWRSNLVSKLYSPYHATLNTKLPFK